jgi:hypothetical protein
MLTTLLQSKINAKLKNARTKKGEATTEKQKQLWAELAEIQEILRIPQYNTTEQTKSLDELIESRPAEQEIARSKALVKSSEVVSREIDRLKMQVDSGRLEFRERVDAFVDIAQLLCQEIEIAEFEGVEASIFNIKTKIMDLGSRQDDAELKELSERCTKIQVEFNNILSEQDQEYQILNDLRDQRNGNSTLPSIT